MRAASGLHFIPLERPPSLFSPHRAATTYETPAPVKRSKKRTPKLFTIDFSILPEELLVIVMQKAWLTNASAPLINNVCKSLKHAGAMAMASELVLYSHVAPPRCCIKGWTLPPGDVHTAGPRSLKVTY